MCVVSMVIDHFQDKWKQQPWFIPNPPLPPAPYEQPLVISPISRQEFDNLAADIEELKKLVVRAKEYDKRNNEPGCEADDKIAFVKRIAAWVGVDLDDVLKK